MSVEVTLELTDPDSVLEALGSAAAGARYDGFDGTADTLESLQDQIVAALPANVPPEPKGHFAIVRRRNDPAVLYIRDATWTDQYCWERVAHNVKVPGGYSWEEIADEVEVVFEGITD